MEDVLIKNGRILNPSTNLDDYLDILIKDGKVFKIEKNIEEENVRIIDASDCFVMPAFVDLHVHFRQPGLEHKETIKTGAASAARGGYSTVCMMPNTKPVVDSVEVLKKMQEVVYNTTFVKCHPLVSITRGQVGDALTDIKALKEAGAVAISEDGRSVMNPYLTDIAFKEAAKYDIPIFDHCEDEELRNDGVINEGCKSEEFNLKGISNAVEDTITARDVILASKNKAHLHLCHISTEGVVKILKYAKQENINVTAEVTPHHLILTDEDILEDDGNFKMNPPLRSKKDRDALVSALASGIIDAIATDHAPHTLEEKEKGFANSPFGITGLDIAAPLIFTHLVDKNILTPLQMAEKMSYNPAKILRADTGVIEVGKEADIVVFNTKKEYLIDSEKFYSKGKNTPFDGEKVKGYVLATIVGGRVIYSNIDGKEELLEK